jgi:DNA-binding MltR family transcriptional regulator
MALSKSKKREALIRVTKSVPGGEEFAAIIIGDSTYSEQLQDRTIALVAAAHIERRLRKAITTHFKVDTDDPEFNSVFENEHAPLGDISSKTRVALALGIVSRQDYNDLDTIRRIRNAFAHTESHLGFTTGPVSDLCDELFTDYDNQLLVAMKTVFLTQLSGSDARKRFIVSAMSLIFRLSLYPGFEDFSQTLLSLASDPIIKKVLADKTS